MKRFENKFCRFLVSLPCRWKVQLSLDFLGSNLLVVIIKYILQWGQRLLFNLVNWIRGCYLREFLLCIYAKSHIQINIYKHGVNSESPSFQKKKKKHSHNSFPPPHRVVLIGMYKILEIKIAIINLSKILLTVECDF